MNSNSNSGKKIAILGAGESGVGAAKLAKKLGMIPFVSDKGEIKEKYRQALDAMDVGWESGQHSEERILSADVLIKSPGIPQTADIVVKAREKNIPVISEIEFAYGHDDGKVIAITGSNGKTTTTMWIYHMLKKTGKKVALGGNVGESYAGKVAEGHHDYYVLEISSFQLEDINAFRPDIAIILNITPDHLDRYEGLIENYADAKFRLIENQGADDYFIYNLDDEIILKNIQKRTLKQHAVPFSIRQKVENGAYLENELLITNLHHNPHTMSIHDLALQGKHNVYNSMAASIAGRILELRKDLIRESLTDFQNIEHRLEFVMQVHGISFINDSKATNVNSTWYALESMSTPVVWIVGGVDKGNDYEQLLDLVKEKVKAIVCLGKDNKKLHKAFEGVVENIVDANTAQDAVRNAYGLGKHGDTVLLSPACASFDLFENYEDRGHQFKQAVRSL